MTVKNGIYRFSSLISTKNRCYYSEIDRKFSAEYDFGTSLSPYPFPDSVMESKVIFHLKAVGSKETTLKSSLPVKKMICA